MNKSFSHSDTIGNFFAGCGLGLLVGLIAGLSVSPVVSVILGSLAAVMAAFLGLKDGEKQSTESTPEQQSIIDNRRKLNGIRAGSFGLACVAGILCGIFVRASDLFVPQVGEQVARWESAGYSAQQAREFVVYERLGISPNWSSIDFGEVQKRKSSALFSGEDKTGICEEIDLQRYNNDAGEVLYAYTQQDLAKLSALANEIKKLKLSTPDTTRLVNAVSEVICELESLSTD